MWKYTGVKIERARQSWKKKQKGLGVGDVKRTFPLPEKATTRELMLVFFFPPFFYFPFSFIGKKGMCRERLFKNNKKKRSQKACLCNACIFFFCLPVSFLVMTSQTVAGGVYRNTHIHNNEERDREKKKCIVYMVKNQLGCSTPIDKYTHIHTYSRVQLGKCTSNSLHSHDPVGQFEQSVDLHVHGCSDVSSAIVSAHVCRN